MKKLLFVLLFVPAVTLSQWITVYYGNWVEWNIEAPCPVSVLDFSLGTHWIWFNFNSNADGTFSYYASTGEPVNLPDRTLPFVNGAHNAGKEALLGIWMGPGAADNITTSMNWLAAEFAQVPWDGIDIDWEPIPTAYYTKFAAWVDSFKTRWPTKTITIACMFEYGEAAVFPIDDRFDQINAMTYDVSGGWNSVSWHNSATVRPTATTWGWLGNIDAFMDSYIDNGVPASKLGFGIECAAYVWYGVTGPYQTGWSSIWDNYYPTYRYVMDEWAAYGIQWDDSAKAGYISTPNAFVSFDPDTAVNYKGKVYLPAKGLGGVIVYEASGCYRPRQADPWTYLKMINHAVLGTARPPDDYVPPLPTLVKSSVTIFDENIATGWWNSSWCVLNRSTEIAHGGSYSYKAEMTSWGGMRLHTGTTWGDQYDVASDSLIFWVYPVGRDFTAAIQIGPDNYDWNRFWYKDTWTRVALPLPQIFFQYFHIMNNTGDVGVVLFVDDIELKANPSGDMPAVPTQVSPDSGASAQPRTGITFKWNTQADADTFNLQVSTSSTFTIIPVNAIVVDTQYTYTGLLNANFTYYWRVLAVDSGVYSGFSPKWPFTTVSLYTSPPEQAMLSSPADAAVEQTLPLTLRWNHLDSVTTYQLHWNLDSSSLVSGVNSTVVTGLTDTAYTIQRLNSGAQYFWRVRGVNDAGNGAWSDIRDFTMAVIVKPPSAMTMQAFYDMVKNRMVVDYQPWTFRPVVSPTDVPLPDSGFIAEFTGGYKDYLGNITLFTDVPGGTTGDLTHNDVVNLLNQSPFVLTVTPTFSQGLNLNGGASWEGSGNLGITSNVTSLALHSADLYAKTFHGDGSALTGGPFTRTGTRIGLTHAGDSVVVGDLWATTGMKSPSFNALTSDLTYSSGSYFDSTGMVLRVNGQLRWMHSTGTTLWVKGFPPTELQDDTLILANLGGGLTDTIAYRKRINNEMAARQLYSDTATWDATVAWVLAQGYSTGSSGGGGTVDTIRTNGFGLTIVRVNDSVYTIAADSTVLATLFDLLSKQAYADTSTWDATVSWALNQAWLDAGDTTAAWFVTMTELLAQNYITSAGVTYENLNANGDVGTGSTQVAAGDHTHALLHAQSHAMTSTSDHTAGNWKVFYTNGSGEVIELGLGASGEYLKSNGASSIPGWAAPSGTGRITVQGNGTRVGTDGANADTVHVDPGWGIVVRDDSVEVDTAKVPTQTSVAAQIEAAAIGTNILDDKVLVGVGTDSVYGWLDKDEISQTSHNHTFDGLSNVLTTGKALGAIPKWNGTNWVDSIDETGGSGGYDGQDADSAGGKPISFYARAQAATRVAALVWDQDSAMQIFSKIPRLNTTGTLGPGGELYLDTDSTVKISPSDTIGLGTSLNAKMNTAAVDDSLNNNHTISGYWSWSSAKLRVDGDTLHLGGVATNVGVLKIHDGTSYGTIIKPSAREATNVLVTDPANATDTIATKDDVRDWYTATEGAVRRSADTTLLYAAHVGLGMATDTALFRPTYYYPAMYHTGTDTLVFTEIRAVGQGSPNLTLKMAYHATIYSGSATEINTSALTVSGTTTGQTATIANAKVPPGVYIWFTLPAVTTQPTALNVTAHGYRSKKR